MSEEVITVVEKPHSVKIAANAKGDVSFEVKSYGTTLNEAKDEAMEIFEALKDEYNK